MGTSENDIERGENGLPILLQSYSRDAVLARIVERFRERAQREVAIVRDLALGVVVMEQEREPCAVPTHRITHHREVAIGIAESQNRPPADVQSDVLDLD